MDAVKAFFLGILALIVIAAIVVGGYLGGWWLNGDMTNRQAHIDRQNYGSQLAYQNKVSDNIAEINTVDTQIANPNLTADQKAGLQAQKAAMTQATCNVYRLIADPTTVPDEQQWAAVHCN